MKMKFIILSRLIFILFFINSSNSNLDDLNFENSYYYEEKYFRILSNNYDSIDPGNFWVKFEENGKIYGIGFNAKKDFGSLILLKDWSMYNFKLTKIIFRNKCSFFKKDDKCNAEMWLYHTKDNGYYPPGRRIFIKQNFFIIVVPFVKADDNNPSNDLLFEFLNLEKYAENQNGNITPKKPVKLYHIIQNQPSYLFEGKFDKKDTLFMVFTQYHFISDSDFVRLGKVIDTLGNTEDINIDYGNSNTDDSKIYRNMRNPDNLNQKVSLMIYSKANYLNNFLLFFIIFLI
jgi:uncharacterized protein YuzE